MPKIYTVIDKILRIFPCTRIEKMANKPVMSLGQCQALYGDVRHQILLTDQQTSSPIFNLFT